MKSTETTPRLTSRLESRERQTKKNRRGFTLMEVLVVIFILMALSSVAVVAFRGTRERTKIDQTLLYIRTLTTQIGIYENHVGRLPTTEQGLNALLQAPNDLANPSKWGGPYLTGNAQTEDPWGNPYQYMCPGSRSSDGFDVWSFGPDGMDGTEDDIGNWTKD